MSKRAVIYARISVSAEESVSIARQVEACRKYAEARGWTLVAEPFIDDGVSATHSKPEDRTGWRALLDCPEPYDVAIVWKVDRLARRVLDFLNAHESLEARAAAVVAVEDPVDMSTAQGRAFATILAVFGEMEAEAIRARVKGARRTLITSGRVAAGMAPYGYINAPHPDGGKVLAKDPERFKYLQEAVSRYLAGESMYQIAQDFEAREVPTKKAGGHWSNSTLQKIFENPILAGMIPYNPGNGSKVRGEAVLRGSDGMPVVRDDLAVMTPADWRGLRERMSSRTLRKVNSTNALLSGLVECAHCDAPMYRAGRKGSEQYVGRFKCKACHAYVSHLEPEVVEQFLAEYGNALPSIEFFKYADSDAPEAEYDLAEIAAQIATTAQEMTLPGADLPALAERLQALHTVREKAAQAAERQEDGSAPFPTYEAVSVAWAKADTVSAKRDVLDRHLAKVRVSRWQKGQALADRVTLVAR